MGGGKPTPINMKQLVISSVELNRNFAFVKGNRQINAKAVAAKVKSIREYGQLSPITVVKGEDVYLSQEGTW